ncbi:hypothetical protein KKF32_02230 [Patescibacteria group bacterium]|nr:hypothetical protein [Patescibacteria group bacterium]
MAEKNENDHGEILAHWNFPEFAKHQRSKSWYFWMTVIFLALLFYSFMTINFLFAVIIIIAAITFFLIYRREPSQINFKINEDGIEADDRFFSYENIKNFYIIYQPPEVQYLFFEFKSVLKPRLAIPLINQNPSQISKILSEFLKEDFDKEDEPLSNNLSRRLKL